MLSIVVENAIFAMQPDAGGDGRFEPVANASGIELEPVSLAPPPRFDLHT